MRAMAIREFGGPDKLEAVELPTPAIEDDQVLVKVKAAGVNPVDWKARGGYLKDRLQHVWPVVPGWELSGVVEEVGDGVDDVSEGDEIYAFTRGETYGRGSYAEYMALPAAHVAPKPASLSFTDAAAVPLTALTAYQALHEVLAVSAHESILIQGAAGGVGGWAVQLAKLHEAYVMGTASEDNHGYVREFGADVVIDYRRKRFEEVVQVLHPDGICCVFDTVGDEVTDRSAKLLPPGGRLCSIAKRITAENYPKQRIKAEYHFVYPSREQLIELGELIEAGDLKLPEVDVLPLAEARKAHQVSETRHHRGRLVLEVG